MPKPLPWHLFSPQKGGGALLHSVKAKTQPAVRNMYRSVSWARQANRWGDRGHVHPTFKVQTCLSELNQQLNH